MMGNVGFYSYPVWAYVCMHEFVYFTHMWLWKPVVKKASKGKINHWASDSCPFPSQLPILPHMPHVPQEMTGCLALLASCMLVCSIPLSFSVFLSLPQVLTHPVREVQAPYMFRLCNWSDRDKKQNTNLEILQLFLIHSDELKVIFIWANKLELAKQWYLDGECHNDWWRKESGAGRLNICKMYYCSVIQNGIDNA